MNSDLKDEFCVTILIVNTDFNYKDYKAFISEGKIQYNDNVDDNAMTRCHEAVP